MNCTICNDTGKRAGSDYLDCGHCGAAAERVALESWVVDQPLHQGKFNQFWAIHQRAREIEREAHAEAAKQYKAQIDDLDQQNTALTNECRGMQAEKEAQAARIAELEAKISQQNMLLTAAAAVSARPASVQPSAPAVEQQPIGYLRQSEIDKMADPRVAGVGMMLHKEPGEGKVAVYAAPQAADTDKVRLVLGNKLYNDIINIRCEVPPSAKESVNGEFFYKIGHRDARHAAAELAASMAAQAPVREVPEVTSDMMNAGADALREGMAMLNSGRSYQSICKKVFDAMLAAAPLPAAPVRKGE